MAGLRPGPARRRRRAEAPVPAAGPGLVPWPRPSPRPHLAALQPPGLVPLRRGLGHAVHPVHRVVRPRLAMARRADPPALASRLAHPRPGLLARLLLDRRRPIPLRISLAAARNAC